MTPGEAERAKFELNRAEAVLEEALTLLGTGSREGSANRLHYAVFHAARAALTVKGLYSKTHSGQIFLFERTFGPAPLLEKLFELRGRADYSMEEFTEPLEDLKAISTDAGDFIERCRRIVGESLARGPDEPDPPPDL
jgi:uncharacterized protein (UPF0332 family)